MTCPTGKYIFKNNNQEPLASSQHTVKMTAVHDIYVLLDVDKHWEVCIGNKLTLPGEKK